MNNFMDGLEKFGLKGMDMSNLFDDEPKEKEEPKPVVEEKKEKEEPEIKEEDLLFDKNIECVVCDRKFQTRAVRSSKVRRIGADDDLRPRYKGIDTIKYDVYSCPYCGYTAMSRYFEGISLTQIKLIREGVGSKFQPTTIRMPDVIDYDTAIDRYKLALYNSVVKRSRISERAYTCLKLSWLCRGKAEELLDAGSTSQSEEVILVRKEEAGFYEQAYEGFMKAIASESFPICGMDKDTIDYLLAEMSFALGKYDIASKLVSRLLGSNANKHVKDKTLDLKQSIIKKLRENS